MNFITEHNKIVTEIMTIKNQKTQVPNIFQRILSNAKLLCNMLEKTICLAPEQDIRDMFRNDPQGSADVIRSRGECFYSNRATKAAVIV